MPDPMFGTHIKHYDREYDATEKLSRYREKSPKS